MKCKAIQRYLLGLENPGQPEAAVQAHVERCPACFEWQRRLLQIERHVPLLPVPASTARDSFRLKLLLASEGGRPRAARPTMLARSEGRFAKAWQRHPVALGLAAAGLAATLVMMVLGAWMSSLSHTTSTGPNLAERIPDPVLENLLQQDLQLAGTDSPRKQVGSLANMADVLQVGSRRLAQTAPAEDLQELNGMIQRLVREGILPRARELPIDEREQLLKPILERLTPSDPAAEVPAPASIPFHPLDDAEQVRRLHRNRGLIHELVAGGLRLASESDPLKRAGYCNGMAISLADEIDKAARNLEGPRALELGRHYQAMLKRGVAMNLSTAGQRHQPGSAGEKQMLLLGSQVVRIAQPLQNQLERASLDRDAHEDMQNALQSVFEGRTEVEKALKGRRSIKSK